MKILLADTAGYCYGVNRAVNMLEKACNENNGIYTLGEIIHNSNVVSYFKTKGVKVIENVKDIDPNSVVVIRSHGVSGKIIEEISGLNSKIIDATCPFVKKIHNIVEKFSKMRYNVLIVGDVDHPEVRGIVGWCCNEPVIINDISQLDNLSFEEEKLCVVSQTTFDKNVWNQLKSAILDKFPFADIHDTICDSTSDRQKEIAEISKVSDAVIVIGGKHSSNTSKLYEVAKSHCDNVFHIETADELNDSIFKFNCVGVTAGASTPAYIIKEVIHMLEEKEMNFEEALENTLKPLNTGDIVKGTVIKITQTEVYVDLDTKADGIIPVDQVTIKPNANVEDILSVGQEVEAFVVRVNDVEGYITLSMRKLESMAAQKEVVEAFENGTPVTGVVTEVVKGGVIVIALGTKIFVPASLATERYTEDLSSIVGNEVTLKIIEMDRRRRKVVGNVKELLVAEKKVKADALWADLEVGKEYDGVVKSVTNFGAFVDIGGVDGLVHVSELTWDRIKHPSEFVKPGDVLKVTVLSFDPETRKISLGHKKAEDNPWLKAMEFVREGEVVKCKIVRLMPFGAFAEIIPGVDGLIHISQIADRKIGKPADVLEIGQEVEAKVVEVNEETKKIGLSIRALIAPESVVEPVAETSAEEVAVEENAEVSETQDAE